MNNRSRSFLYCLVSLAVVMAYLATAISVQADDGTPPLPTEEPGLPPTQEPVAADTPSGTDLPAAAEITADGGVPTQEPVVQEETSVDQILSQFPEGTDVVVLDEDGNPLPMASQQAADAILSDPDPMWCPEVSGVQILPGGAGCTSYFNRFTTASGLINTLQGGTYGGPGTIYISSGDIAAADQNKNIVLNGTSLLTLSSDNLTIQGGWDFGSNTVNNRSVFVNSTFEIKNWTGNITVNDLKFDLASGISGDGLSIKNIDGNVTLNNVVIADSNNDNGLFINNVDDIVINDSKFNNNDQNGADLNADGTIELNNVTARDNGEHGVDAYANGDITILDGIYQRNGRRGVRAQSDNGTIDVTGSEFINNQMSGIRAEAYNGSVTLSNVYSAKNGIHGANLFASDTITIQDGDFYNNDASGVHTLPGSGSLSISDSQFTFNDKHGLYAEFQFGAVTISNSEFSDNGLGSEGRGLIVHSLGDITLADVTVNENGGGGAELANCFLDLFGSGGCLNSLPAQITLSGTNLFTDNGFNPVDISALFGGSPGSGPYGSVGLWAESTNGVTLSGVTAQGNGFGDLGGGAFIFTQSGALSIANRDFSGNCTIYCDFLGFGFLGINEGGPIALSGVTANGNGDPINGLVGFGAFLVNNSGNLFVENSDFSGNCGAAGSTCGGGGIEVSASGDVLFDQVTASGNGTTAGFGSGASIDAGGNVDIYCSTFSNNGSFGLSATIPGGSSMTLNGVTFGGNGIGDIDFTGGTLGQNPLCNPSGGGGGGSGSSSGFIPVTGGEQITCDGTETSKKVLLPDGDFVVLPCPINEYGLVMSTSQADLPDPLAADFRFLSALTAFVIRANQPVELLDHPMTVSFLIPAGVDTSRLAILFWDGSTWIEVEGAHVSDDGHFEASTDQVGTFVLVLK